MWQQGDADVCAHESIQQCSNTKTKNMKETWSKLMALGVFCYTERHDSNKDQTAFLWFRKKANLHNRLFSLNMPMLCFFGFNPVLICMQLLTSEMTGDTFRLFRWMLCAGVWTPHDFIWLKMQRLKVHSEAQLAQSAPTDFSLCSQVSLLLMVLRSSYNIKHREVTDIVTWCYINTLRADLDL